MGLRRQVAPFQGRASRTVTAVAVTLFVMLRISGAWGRELDGRKAFENTCTPCHAFDKDAVPDMYGQTLNLYGVIGRRTASVSDFEYSDAMKATYRIWDAQAIETFIIAPKKFIPGTRMELPGVSDANVRRAIVEFLATANQPAK
jgi:cytochrome c